MTLSRIVLNHRESMLHVLEYASTFMRRGVIMPHQMLYVSDVKFYNILNQLLPNCDSDYLLQTVS